jgi:hypothetical protein
MKNNKIARLLEGISWVFYFVGFFVGFFVMGEEDFLIALIWWIGSFIGGTLLLGFAEIINLLQQLVNKQSEVKAVEKSVETFTDLPTL